ncbi:LysR family transcriptional regulator [Oceanobacillus oncorhynchi subsp. oncorhynchi]|uniref:LysR family transcriptional regulator n=1 Tax=Oceanobacillus TaxID=182709 RepID=UPI0030D90556
MLKNMEYVYAVYLNKSFSKAAGELYISQPALSATIKKVEEEIGLPIFDRSSNPIQLTKAGEYYIESIKAIMNIEKEMRSYFSHLAEDNQGTISVGGASFFCTHILPKIAQEFKEEYPDYRVNLLEANADDLIKCLRTGIVDMMIDVEKKDISKMFDSFVWAEEHILLAVPSSYEINNKLRNYQITFQNIANGNYLSERYPKINLKEFQNEDFLLLKKGNDLHQRSLKMCRNAGFTPTISMYLDQMLTSYYIASNEKGIAFVRASVTHYLEATNKLCFYKIDDDNARQNIMLYYKKTQPLPKVGTDFISFIKEKKIDHL